MTWCFLPVDEIQVEARTTLSILHIEELPKGGNILLCAQYGSGETVAAVVDENEDRPIVVGRNRLVPRQLQCRVYKVTVQNAKRHVLLLEETLDLVNHPVNFEVIGNPDSAKLGDQYLKTAEIIAGVGLPSSEAIAYLRSRPVWCTLLSPCDLQIQGSYVPASWVITEVCRRYTNSGFLTFHTQQLPSVA